MWHAAQHRLGLGDAPWPSVRPQVQEGDLVGAGQCQRDVASVRTDLAKTCTGDAREGQVEGQVQHDANAHRDPLVCDGVDRRASAQHGQPECDAERQHHQRQRHADRFQRGGWGAAVVQHEGAADDQDGRKVQRQRAHMEHMAGQHAPIWRALPQHPFSGGQRLRQAVLGLELVFVRVAVVVHFHTSGS